MNRKRSLSIETGGFSNATKKATGYKSGMGDDLSHKVSASQINTQFKVLTKNPSKIQGKYLDVLEQATNISHVSKKGKQEFKSSLKYLQNHSSYQQHPMSPTSEKHNFIVHSYLANKNQDNLRPKKLQENRSIQQYPHFEINNGELSPRSKKLQNVVSVFSQNNLQDLSPEQKRVNQAYNNIGDELKKKIKTTSDQIDYASTNRKK